MKLLSIIVFQLIVAINVSSVRCDKSITKLCAPEAVIIPLNVSSSTINPSVDSSDTVDESFDNYANCDCRWENVSPWGQMSLRIVCHEKQFENRYFEVEQLLPFTDRLDLSWNNFEFAPKLIGSDLSQLDISHNAITTVDDNNFAQLPNLKVLNLSSNEIIILSVNAFRNLTKMEVLDLSKNQLKMLTINVFAPLLNLKHLILSRNKHINETLSQKSINLYLSLGVVPTLEILEIEGTNLASIDMTHAVGLKELKLKENALRSSPDIPRGLEYLDLSRNPITLLTPKFLPNLGSLISLHLNDMPHLVAVKDFALFGLPNLKHLSFQGSWNLSEFSGDVFGSLESNSTVTELETFSLRGTSLRTLNSTIKRHLNNAKWFDLNGVPLSCDCNLKWIIDLGIETSAKCVKPLQLRGRRLSNISESQLKCKRWPDWVCTLVNGILVLILLLISIVATWFLVMGLKPLKNIRPNKLSATSPYARITIEPNRVEDLHTLR